MTTPGKVIPKLKVIVMLLWKHFSFLIICISYNTMISEYTLNFLMEVRRKNSKKSSSSQNRTYGKRSGIWKKLLTCQNRFEIFLHIRTILAFLVLWTSYSHRGDTILVIVVRSITAGLVQEIHIDGQVGEAWHVDHSFVLFLSVVLAQRVVLVLTRYCRVDAEGFLLCARRSLGHRGDAEDGAVGGTDSCGTYGDENKIDSKAIVAIWAQNCQANENKSITQPS